MKKAIIEIVGGLGNQFFIYSTAKQIEEEQGFKLSFDPSYYSWWPRRKNFAREFELQHFECDITIATGREIRKVIWRTNNRYINTLLKRKRYFSNSFNKDFEVLENGYSKDAYVSGFQTNTKYILRHLEKFRKDFSLKSSYILRIKNKLAEIKGGNSVSISVRRGDLLEFKDGNVIGLDYYKKAIEIIESKTKNLKFYVFSDDIKWCKGAFKFLENVEFIDRNTASQDFELIKNCKHNIIANSTLSWWAAILNSNKNKIVIAPREFHNRTTHKNPDLNFFPEGWALL